MLGFRKPEPVEVVILVVSAIIVVTVANEFAAVADSDRTAPLIGFAPLLIGIGIAILLCETFVAAPGLRVLFLTAHFLYACGIPALLNSVAVIAPVSLAATIVFQVALRLPTAYAAAIAGVAIATAVATGLSQSTDPGELALGSTVIAMLAFAAVHSLRLREELVIARRIVDQQLQSLDSLETANTSFVEHLTSVEEESAERERLRITRELHDSIGYGMTNVAMMMNAARYLVRTDPQKLVEYCERTHEMATTTLQDTRSTLYKLRSIAFRSRLSLHHFFTRLCSEFEASTGVATSCHMGNLPNQLPESLSTVLFRAVQVGFINALRHGHSRTIKLLFWCSQDWVQMTIWNDLSDRVQREIDVAEGIGLRGMRERVEERGGRVKIRKVADGFQLTIELPLAQARSG